MSVKLIVVYPVCAPLVSEVLTRRWKSTPCLPVLVHKKTLNFSSPGLIEEIVMAIGYIVGCYGLLVYYRQCSISGSSLLIMIDNGVGFGI
jgi:hypothetical protein